jgi:hypothetical protein
MKRDFAKKQNKTKEGVGGKLSWCRLKAKISRLTVNRRHIRRPLSMTAIWPAGKAGFRSWQLDMTVITVFEIRRTSLPFESMKFLNSSSLFLADLDLTLNFSVSLPLKARSLMGEKWRKESHSIVLPCGPEKSAQARLATRVRTKNS